MQRQTMQRLEMTKPHEDLRREDNLFDITLVCEGGQVKAHKLILQSSSEFFREVFAANPTLPLMYLRGVDRTEMVSLLDFMYQRHVNVPDSDLESFIELGKDLKVKDDLFRTDHVPPSHSFRRPSTNAYLRRSRNESPRRKRKQEIGEGPRYKCRLRECHYKGAKAHVYLHMEKKHNINLTPQQREIVDDAIIGGREATRRFVTPRFVATSQGVYDVWGQGEQFYAEEDSENGYVDDCEEQLIADEQEPEDGYMEEQGSVIDMENAEDVDNESGTSSFKVPPPPARNELFITRNEQEDDDDTESLSSAVIASKAVLMPDVKGRKKFKCIDCSFMESKPHVFSHWEETHNKAVRMPEVIGRKRFRCRDCSFVESRPQVLSHWEETHSAKEKKENAGEEDDDNESLTSLMKVLPVKGRNKFRCSETDCSFVEKSRPQVLSHWEETHSDRGKKKPEENLEDDDNNESFTVFDMPL